MCKEAVSLGGVLVHNHFQNIGGYKKGILL